MDQTFRNRICKVECYQRAKIRCSNFYTMKKIKPNHITFGYYELFFRCRMLLVQRSGNRQAVAYAAWVKVSKPPVSPKKRGNRRDHFSTRVTSVGSFRGLLDTHASSYVGVRRLSPRILYFSLTWKLEEAMVFLPRKNITPARTDKQTTRQSVKNLRLQWLHWFSKSEKLIPLASQKHSLSHPY